MQNIYLISEFGYTLRNIPFAFSGPQVKIYRVGGPNSKLKKQENFREIPRRANHSFIQSLLLEEQFIESLNGFVIIGTDAEMREIAEAEIDLNIKLKLLPIKNPTAFKILDSKVGFQSVVTELQISAPQGFVIENTRDLEKIKISSDIAYFLKGDKGGGGAAVHKVSASTLHSKALDMGYPFLIQEEIIGSDIAIEAFFVHGILRAYIYSDQVKSVSQYGVSYQRRIARPKDLDFLSTLQSMGEYTGIHGFVNTSFIFNPTLGKHLLFEFDPRPNAWHFLTHPLGINLSKIIIGPETGSVEAPNVHDFRITLLERFLTHIPGISHPRQLTRVCKNLFDSDLVIMGGKKISKIEMIRILIFYVPRYLLLRNAKKCFRLLPSSITTPIKRRGVTGTVAGRITGEW
jgi:hypothetical protein